MRQYFLIASVLGMFLSTETVFAEQKNKQAKISEKKEKALDLTIPNFEINGQPLPKNYSGIDAKLFYQFMASKQEDMKKGEFETKTEFELRTKNLPINLKDDYAFDISFGTKKYDADKQQYLIAAHCSKMGGRFSCTANPSLSFEKSTYNSSNAYGATATVEKVRLRTFGLLINENNPLLADEGDQSSRSQIDVNFKLPMPIEKAKILKDKTIKTLIVGEFVNAIIDERVRYSENPTISSPTDTLYWEYFLHFFPKKIVMYVLETGEILAIKTRDNVDYKYSIEAKRD